MGAGAGGAPRAAATRQEGFNKPWPDGSSAGGVPAEALCLRREAAHNLALLYSATGAPGLARAIVRRYLVI